jgi:hypothetical protein
MGRFSTNTKRPNCGAFSKSIDVPLAVDLVKIRWSKQIDRARTLTSGAGFIVCADGRQKM